MLDKARALQQNLQTVLDWMGQQDLQDPEYDKWLAGLQLAEGSAEKLVSLLEQLEQHPEQVQNVLLTAYETTGKILGQQLAVLERIETDLQKRWMLRRQKRKKNF